MWLMELAEFLEASQECEVIWDGHFKLASGPHSNRFWQCAKFFERTDLPYCKNMCKELAVKLFEILPRKDVPDCVIGPAVGAINMAFVMGDIINLPNIFAERVNGKFVLKRGFQIVPGKKYIIVEDVTTSGGSVMEIIKLIQDAGGIVVAVACVVDRSEKEIDFGVPHIAIMRLRELEEIPPELQAQKWEADECPLCKKDIPITVPGTKQAASA